MMSSKVEGRFDPAALGLLRRVGGEKLASKMGALFLDGAPRKIAAARAALMEFDSTAFALAAHSLKSSAGQMGALKLQALCAELEAAVPSEQTKDSLRQLLDLADAEVSRAVSWLEENLQNGGNTA